MVSDDMKEKMKTAPSKVLAAHVVLYRGLKMEKELALLAMHELSKRKVAGDDFDFEAYIKEELDKLPKRTEMDLTNVMKGINIDGIMNIVGNVTKQGTDK